MKSIFKKVIRTQWDEEETINFYCSSIEDYEKFKNIKKASILWSLV